MGTGKMEFSPSLFLFKHILLDHIKRRRPNIQNCLMKPHLRKVITPLIHCIFLKFQKFQISNIVFQVIGRIGNDQIVDILNGRIIRYPISVEKSRRIGKFPAIVMDSHIGKCI